MEREREIRAVQMDNLKGLLGIRKMDTVLNEQIMELCSVTKGLMKVFSGGLDVRQARRMVYDRNEWWRFMRRNAWGIAWGISPSL